jgi:hypothetical protein
MKVHELKLWDTFYQEVHDYRKRFELRKSDRDFKVGDTLYLREFNPNNKKYTGRSLMVEVLYILSAEMFHSGPEDMVILSIGEPFELKEE